MVFKLEDIGRPNIKGSRKRRGRGLGCGLGKTSGRGHKGAKARSGGGGVYAGFEGGQMPLIRRTPKRGFTNVFKKEFNIVNVGIFETSEFVKNGAVVDKALLLSSRIIRKKRIPIKVLGTGKLTKALTVRADNFSESARKAIESAGGKAEVVKS